MERKQVPFDMVYDVRGVRIIVPDTPACYSALGLIHSSWRPIQGEIDDYIAAPKDNFYRSLHTAVLFDDGNVSGNSNPDPRDASERRIWHCSSLAL